MKITNKQKRSFREVAKTLPVYYETINRRKIIHHKEIERLDLVPEEGLNQFSDYTAVYRTRS